MPSFVEPPAAAGDPTILTPDQKEWQALVKRIAASEVLARASQLREILLYVVHRSLHDTYPIKERDIACEVLKRPPNFDGTLDNIVRVQVGHLRRKLDQYFATEGKDEPLLIVIPRGSYIPRFELRDRPVDKVKEEPVEPEAVAPLAPAHEEEIAHAPARLRPWWIAIAAGIAIVVGLSVLAMRTHATSAVAAAGMPLAAPRNSNLITQYIFRSNNSVSVVAADTNLLLIEAILHRDVSISEYSAPNFPNNVMSGAVSPEVQEMVRLIAVRRYTSFGDTSVMLLSSKVAASFGKEISPRYSRMINMQDLQRGNFIFIGKSPWLSLFDPKLNFIQQEDPATHTHAFLNRNPLPGEPGSYAVIGNWSTESTSYASIALLPNLAHTGYVLILDGTGMEATEAAMEFLSSPESGEKLKQMLKGRELDDSAPLEVLLRVYSVQGIAHDFEIAAVRSQTK
ncbi:hypothetical protein SAMN05421770_10827 [Granulicella rosea]|uniref:Transcriptional regulatory protein, C terminal n=1 Tax=Granulicella rosea TaxID=474952 RepID=A0A239LY20_9BACT|nr:hypothetical protein [Granulicella rosea]SNT34768.1 hypothetical protein SAMN05421770_10827 [Granulicella rosea]